VRNEIDAKYIIESHAAWAEGHIYRDRSLQYSADPGMYKRISTEGLGRPDFYRGLFEAIGSAKWWWNPRGGRQIPQVTMIGSPMILWAMLEFLYENSSTFDRTCQLAQRRTHTRILVTSVKAQQLLGVLYPEGRKVFGLPTKLEIIRQLQQEYVPACRGSREHRLLQDTLVSRKLALGATPRGSRIEYQQWRPF
jgi:hypothetical protein